MGIVYDSAQRKQLLNFQQASHVLRRVEGENTDKSVRQGHPASNFGEYLFETWKNLFLIPNK